MKINDKIVKVFSILICFSIINSSVICFASYDDFGVNKGNSIPNLIYPIKNENENEIAEQKDKANGINENALSNENKQKYITDTINAIDYAYWGRGYKTASANALTYFILPYLNRNATKISNYYNHVINEQNSLKTKYNYTNADNLYIIDMDDLLNSTTAQELYKKNVNNFLNKIEKDKNRWMWRSFFSKVPVICTTTDDIKVCDFDKYENGKLREILYSNVSDEYAINNNYYVTIPEVDWYVTIGDSVGGIVAEVESIPGDKLKVDLNYYLNDYYDWSNDDTKIAGTSISQFTEKQLRNVGYGRNYRMVGKYTHTYYIDLDEECDSNNIYDQVYNKTFEMSYSDLIRKELSFRNSQMGDISDSRILKHFIK